MMADDEIETDEQLVEYCRAQMQECIDRCDFGAPSEQDLLLSVGVPVRSLELRLAEVHEIGRFDLVPPLDKAPHLRAWPPWLLVSVFRHWVYVDRERRPHALSLRRRRELITNGSTRIQAFVHDPDHPT
jgi:hypothetical protein